MKRKHFKKILGRVFCINSLLHSRFLFCHTTLLTTKEEERWGEEHCVTAQKENVAWRHKGRETLRDNTKRLMHKMLYHAFTALEF